MKSLEEFAEMLVKSIVKKADLIKVTTHEEEENIKLDILVSKDEMGSVIGKNGKTIRAIRTLIYLYAYQNHLSKVVVDVESF